MLTLEQRIYLVKCYGIGNVSYKYAIEVFNEKYPDVKVTRKAVRKLIYKFDSTGDVKNIKKTKKQLNEDDAATLVVLDSVQEHPRWSLRKRSINLGISKSHIQRILVSNKFYAFKPKFIHKLQVGDDARRLDFCLTMGEKILADRSFHRNILFTDESTFTTNGVVSSQNCRYWAQENPNFRITTNSQKFKKVNVWCGIMHHRIIGPYFMDGNLNQNTYLEILNNFVLGELDNENLEFRRKIIFQQDGCPAHSTILVRQWLDNHFHDRWIGRYGPTAWPARSPDLTPLDYFLWGYLKQKVYANDFEDDVDLLKQKIVDAVATINEDVISSVYEEFRKRLEKCVLVGGLHVE